jgi:hypothetical protein
MSELFDARGLPGARATAVVVRRASGDDDDD